MKTITPAVIILSILFVIIGCSAVTNDPVAPDMPSGNDLTFDSQIEESFLTGIFELFMDKSILEAKLTPLRNSKLYDSLETVDITSFLQLSPCLDCVKIDSVGINLDGDLIVKIGIKHPFSAGKPEDPITGRNRADLHVFNVEGLVYSNSTEVLNYPELNVGIVAPFLLNASGYSNYLDAQLDNIYPTIASAHPYIVHFDDYSKGNFDVSNPMGFESVTTPPPAGNLVMAMGSDYDFQDYVFTLNQNPISFIFTVSCTYGISALSCTERFQPVYRIPQFNKKAASEIYVVPPADKLEQINPTREITLEVHVVDVSHNVPGGFNIDQMFFNSSVQSVDIEIPGIFPGKKSKPGNSNISGSGHSDADPLVYLFTFSNELSADVGIYHGLVKVKDSYPVGMNQSIVILGKDGIHRVIPGTSPTDGAFEIAEFAAYAEFAIEVELGEIDNPTIYDVGPGFPYADPSEVPWETIEPNSIVQIHWRDEPYADKWVIARTASDAEPIVVRGILDNGRRPVITGENAKTRQELDYWNEKRSVIKIGGASFPNERPSNISIENLDIRSAHPFYTFTDDSGNQDNYGDNAAAIHIESGDFITIRNCILHDSGNGLFVSNDSTEVMIEKNHIYDNGNTGSAYEHNSYTEALGITFQFNYYGPLKAGSEGNNLKDRSAGTVVRYNWIETGSRMCDFVDSHKAELLNDQRYRETFVYGNVLIKTDLHGNGGVIHYGGDSGTLTDYRKGTLWLFNNTVISYRTTRTTLLQLSSNDEHVESFNNLFFDEAGGNQFYVMDSRGDVDFYNNWLQEGWHDVNGSLQGAFNEWDNIVGLSPDFIDFANEDFHISSGSECENAGDDLPSSILPDHYLLHQYVKHQLNDNRHSDGILDIGAFEIE